MAATTGVFPAVLCAKNEELVAVLSVQPEKSPQTGMTFVGADHLEHK